MSMVRVDSVDSAATSRRSVEIGGASLDAVVAGDGPVTVVFVNGLGPPLEQWDLIAPRIASRTRTLRYDRRRAPATGPVPSWSASDMVIDLRKLLTALALPPPYVLVGHSYGGVIIRLFAASHSSEVAGLVFVDATHEVVDSAGMGLLPLMYSLMGLMSRLSSGRRWLLKLLCPPKAPPAYRARVEQRLNDSARWAIELRTSRAEGGGLRASLAHLKRDCSDLPAVPVHVLTASASGANAKGIARVHEAWKAMVERAPHARYTNVPASSHYMTVDAPDEVVQAILDVLDRR
jgi:pimeloyl-ACP methyl ester carboxylesterase